MRRLLMLAAIAGLALARPETYREKEDFQFSRSSTDEGSKSGYYGAQRGNMGGNYEKAHNMDSLAQNQMSGLVRTVEGELGDGAKQTSGSVFSSANSRGVYGSSGQSDLSNLQGRNFQEGETLGSQSHSSLTSHHGSGYKGQYSSFNSGSSLTQDSRRGGYSSAGNSEQTLYNNRHHQASDNSQSVNQYSSLSDRRQLEQSALNSGYYSQAAGYQDYRNLTQITDGYGSDIHSRLVSGKPVRIVIRPGTKVVVPVAAQTYDASRASSFDQNAVNSETDVLNSNEQFAVVTPKIKHYESSYSYRKEWEKHNTQPTSGVVPLVIPTVNSYPANSELYEDVQRQTGQHRQSASEIASQTRHSSHQSGYNVNAASSSQQTQADYNGRLYSSGANTGSSAHQSVYNGGSNSAYGLDTSAQNHRLTSGAYIGANGASSLNKIEDSNTKPKSYQSSYSYHKSWERQGDPYIIQPSSNGLYNGEASGKLTAASLNQGYGTSHQYGTHHQTHQGYSSNADCDCDEQGHIRVARSPRSHHHQAHTRGDVGVVEQEDLGQQVQQQWGDVEQFGQQTQTQWDKIEDLGQQTQNTWDQVGQQTETKWDNLKEEGQQTQVLWDQQETQKQSDKIEQFEQQSQNQWDQQDVGQQTQVDWNQQNTQQTELGQQTQDTWTTLETKPIDNPASQIEQQTSGFDYSSQHSHSMDHQSNGNTFEIAQTSNDQKITTESHTLETNKSSNHHVHNIWDEIKREEIGQENEDTNEDLTQTTNLGHQTHTMWGGISVNENSFKNQETDNTQGSSNAEPFSNTFNNKPNPHPWMYNQVHHHENQSSTFAHSSSSSSFSESHSHSWQQQQHSTNMNSNSFNTNSQRGESNGSTFGTSIMSLWDKLDNIEKQTIPSKGNDDHYEGQLGSANVFDTRQVEHSVFDFHNTDNQTVNTNQHDVLVSPATKKPLQPTMPSVTTTQPTVVITNKVQPHDIGRGDIESDETTSEPTKPYKTPEEIETLSLTKETGKVSTHGVAQENKNREDKRNLSVINLDQAHSENQDEEQSTRQSGASIATSVTQAINDLVAHNELYTDIDQDKKSDMEQQFKNSAHQNYHNLNSFVNKQEDQQNEDQQFVNFGQQNEETQEMEQQFETQNIAKIDSFQQEHNKHEAEELGQDNEQFDQVSLSGWKADENFEQQEHKLENWGQKNENLDQSQSGWTENMENQQVQTGWNPTEDFQQHSQLTDTFEHPMEDINQQVQTVWKPADFEQHSQQSESSKENLNQQVQPAWKPEEELQNSQVPDVFEQARQNENPPAKDNQPEVVEEVIIPKKVDVAYLAPELELVTEKPGFWKSVGSKFTSAEDKVASWFSN